MGSLKNHIKFNFNYLMSIVWKFNLGMLLICSLIITLAIKIEPLKIYVVAYIVSSGIFIFNAGYSAFIIIYQFIGSANYILLRRKFYISNTIVSLIIVFIASIGQSIICFMETQQIYYTINFFIVVVVIYSFFVIINTVVSIATIAFGFKVMGVYALSLIGLYVLGIIGKVEEVLINKIVLPTHILIILLLLIPIIFFIGYNISEKMEVYKSR